MTTSTLTMPRLGAAFASTRASAGVRAFGVVSSDGTAAGLLPLTARVGSWSTGCSRGEHLWMVGSTVLEQMWQAAAPEGPRGVSGLDVGRRSVMRLRVSTTDSAGGTQLELDVGQSLELYAEALQVDLLAPEGSVAVSDAPVPPQQGLLFESRCMVRLLRLEASRGVASALLTETFYVFPGQSHVQRVTAAARRLTAYAEPLAAVPMWRWLRGDPATVAVPLGTVAWSTDRPRAEVDVPSASHLRLEPDPAARVFTLVWTLTL
ncbi:MAG: hypothetical protein AB1Z98_18795 [Nannocystaceae bacterium]